MTAQARFRRIGWFALLGVCTLLYSLLHLQVWAVSSDVKRSERQIVRLERQNLLLETEFLTRSSQLQLATWNRVDFGYTAPRAAQFVGSERQLASFGANAGEGHEDALHLAAFSADEEAPAFPRLVSPITGQPLDDDLLQPERADDNASGGVIAAVTGTSARVPLNASHGDGGGSTVRVMFGGGQ